MLCRLLFLCLVAVGIVRCFPSGAPEGACPNLTPGSFTSDSGMLKGHLSPPQSADSFPYKVSCERTETNKVQMTIRGGGFRGLLAQVQDQNGKAIGRVDPASLSSDYQAICDTTSITHKKDNVKFNEVFSFMIPLEFVHEELKCVVTVVKSKNEYWVSHITPLQGGKQIKTMRMRDGSSKPGQKRKKSRGEKKGRSSKKAKKGGKGKKAGKAKRVNRKRSGGGD